MDTITHNHIDGWSLIREMPGSAFSTALRHAALMPMGEALEIGGLGYDISGNPVQSEDVDDPNIALLIDISADISTR